MNWDDMKVFLAIAKERGLKKAARTLDMHHTSCARRIKAFEEELGVRLFDRLAAGYVLTQSGEALMESAEVIRQEFNSIEVDLMGKDRRLEGDICLTIPIGFATKLLMPELAEFMLQYPDVNLEINMTYAIRDLANREADVAIRHVDDPPYSLSGRQVARIHRSAYASKRYLENHDPVRDPERCHWLGWGDARNHLQWAEKSRFPKIPVRGNLYSDVLQLEAVKAHLGIATLPCFIGDGEPGLERIPGAKVSAGKQVWALAHKDMMSNVKVRTLIDFLYDAFQRQKSKIEGQL